MKLQKLETQEEERHCEEHLQQVKRTFKVSFDFKVELLGVHTKGVFHRLFQIASLEDEVFQLKSAHRDKQEKTTQQSTTMHVEMNQVRALIQVRKFSG